MTYGTERANAYRLIEDALNLKDTRIFDYETDENGNKISILNKKETMLASQKQDLIKEEFKNWVFKEPNRREKLIKIYNKKFNSVRLREFDGSHLTLDGINPEIKKDFENRLLTYQEELNNAKEEVVKPFQQEKILKEKKERLSELNKLLDMGNNDKMKENSWNKEKERITR